MRDITIIIENANGDEITRIFIPSNCDVHEITTWFNSSIADVVDENTVRVQLNAEMGEGE